MLGIERATLVQRSTPSLIISDQTRRKCKCDILVAAIVGISPMPSCSVVPSSAKRAIRSPMISAASLVFTTLGVASAASTSSAPSMRSSGISASPKV